MIWLALLWPVSWVLIFAIRVNACWQAAKKVPDLQRYLLHYGMRSLVWTILKSCLLADRSDVPIFLLGPVGLYSVWIARRPA